MIKLNEVWKPVIGYEEYYEVSSFGRVRSLDRVIVDELGRVRRLKGVKVSLNVNQGYNEIHLYKEGKRYPVKVCQLVLEAFVGLKPDGLIICHKNDVRFDDSLPNLYWGTWAQNRFDPIRNGKVDPEVAKKALRDFRSNGGYNPGNLGKKHSLERIEKHRLWHLGRKRSEEARRNMSMAQSRRWNRYHKNEPTFPL